MAQRRPNVLLITCDQWRADALSAAGHPVVKTPNSDALAAEGVLFENHFAGAAPCSPARACLYTGLYQMNNRVCRNGTPMDRRHGNLALAARALGYDPTLFGYTDVSPDPRNHAAADPLLRTYEGVLPGFTSRQLLPEHQKPWLSWLASRGHGNLPGYPEVHHPARGPADALDQTPPVYGKDETLAAFIAGEFARWVSEQDAGAPWFAHLSFLSPHPPFIVPEPYNTMYDPGSGRPFHRLPDWQAEAASHPFLDFAIGRQKKDNFRPGAKGKVRDWSEEDFRRIRALYWGMVSETDAQLGNVFAAVKASGGWDDTVVILTSDHAEMLGDHFMLGKGGWFDGSYRIPLVVRDPRRTKSKGSRVSRFTEAVDIFPTLLDLLGGTPRDHLDGRSLAPFLDGTAPKVWRDAAHWEFDFRNVDKLTPERHFGLSSQQCNLAVVRTERYKYVHFGGGLPPLLYDLKDDPGECRNLADDPAHAATRLAMAERLLAWRAEHLDQSMALAKLVEAGVAGYVAPAH